METCINEFDEHEFTVQEYLENGTAADLADAIIEHAVYCAKHDLFNAIYIEFDDGTSHIFADSDAEIAIDVCKHENIPF